jgi:signal peptidase I
LADTRGIDTERERAPSGFPGDPHLAEEERISLARTFGGRSALRELLETVLLAVIVFFVLNLVTGRFQVRGSSMTPTLHDGEYLIIGKVSYWFHPPERGDIIVFHPPTNPQEDYIKRVIGLPGETVEIRDGRVWVNGVSLEEPYIVNPVSYGGSWSLREDEYFVLGDNRGNSSDSHTWGVLPKRNIVGKAWLTYWPPEEWGLAPHYVFPASETPVED